EALSNQDLPFEKLIGELSPQRNLNRHPLFQVMFVYQNVPALYEVAGMQIEVQKLDYGTSKFDLNLWAEDIDDDILLTLHYASALFDRKTIRRMLVSYRRMLECALDAPESPIHRLDCFAREDIAFAAGAPEPAAGAASFVRRFEEQARRHPLS